MLKLPLQTRFPLALAHFPRRAIVAWPGWRVKRLRRFSYPTALLPPDFGRKRARRDPIARAVVHHPRKRPTRHAERIARLQPYQRRKRTRRSIVPAARTLQTHVRLPFLPMYGRNGTAIAARLTSQAEHYRDGRRESPLDTILPAPCLDVPAVGSWQGRCFCHRLCQPFNSISALTNPPKASSINQRVCREYSLPATRCQAFLRLFAASRTFGRAEGAIQGKRRQQSAAALRKKGQRSPQRSDGRAAPGAPGLGGAAARPGGSLPP